MEEEKKPYTWAKLKDFCNSLSDEQLAQTVKVIQEEGSLDISYSSEIGEDHYYFPDFDCSTTEEDFNPEVFIYKPNDRRKTFKQVLESEEYILTPKTAVFLFEDF